MEIYSGKILGHIIILACIFWLSVYIIYIFLGWKIRKSVMKKLAKELNFSFVEKLESVAYYVLEGSYFGKNVSIEESDYMVNSVYWSRLRRILFSLIPRERFSNYKKKTTIKVDGKLIYEYKGDVFWPFSSKIKKILNRSINKSLVQNTNKEFLLKLALFFIALIVVIIMLVKLVLMKFVLN